MDSKHGATGTELRLDICVKDGSERTWSHEQVRQRPEVAGGWELRQAWRDAVEQISSWDIGTRVLVLVLSPTSSVVK